MSVGLFIERLHEGRPLVISGPTGTQLSLPEHDVPTPPPLYSANGLLTGHGLAATGRIHDAYAAAGADLVTANTFGLRNPYVLESQGIGPERAREITIRACQLAIETAARASRARRTDVIPLGLGTSIENCYTPEGVLTGSQISAAQERHAANVKAGGMDLIFYETLPNSDEALRALLAAKKAGLVVAGLNFFVERQPDGSVALQSGETLRDALRPLRNFGYLTVGVNCGPDDVTEDAIGELKDLTNRPLAAYPNGLETPPDDTPDSAPLHADTDRREIARTARRLLAAGVRIIGGCCLTGPDNVRDFRALVDEADAPESAVKGSFVNARLTR